MENNNTRQKLLEAAIDEFTEYGFDGARVARIAKRAGVSQALLYYNFESKQAILDEIIEDFLKANIEHIGSVYSDPDSQTEDTLSDDQLRQSLDFILDKNRETGILLMQALLKSQDNKKVYTIFNELNRQIRDRTLSKYGYRLGYDVGKNRRVVDYFFVLMPFILFGILGKEWSEENDISLAEAQEVMVDVVKSIYNNYLK